jgi:hypothetical protein
MVVYFTNFMLLSSSDRLVAHSLAPDGDHSPPALHARFTGAECESASLRYLEFSNWTGRWSFMCLHVFKNSVHLYADYTWPTFGRNRISIDLLW